MPHSLLDLPPEILELILEEVIDYSDINIIPFDPCKAGVKWRQHVFYVCRQFHIKGLEILYKRCRIGWPISFAVFPRDQPSTSAACIHDSVDGEHSDRKQNSVFCSISSATWTISALLKHVRYLDLYTMLPGYDHLLPEFKRDVDQVLQVLTPHRDRIQVTLNITVWPGWPTRSTFLAAYSSHAGSPSTKKPYTTNWAPDTAWEALNILAQLGSSSSDA